MSNIKPQASDLLKLRKITLLKSLTKEDKQDIKKDYNNMLLLRIPQDKK